MGELGNGSFTCYFEEMTENKQTNPLISVITVVFNGDKSLEATIKSIVSQLTEAVEYIIIDGGSCDGTLDIIRRYSNSIAYWVSEPDMGIYDAWNKGIAQSRGKFIAFVGADDVVSENYFTTYLAKITTSPAVDYWSSKVIFAGNKLRVIGKPWSWGRFRRYMSVAHVGSMHKRDLYEKYGLYNISYKIVGDYEFLLRIGAGLNAGFIDEITVTMGVDGVSNKYFRDALLETRMAKLHNSTCNQFVADFDILVAILKGMFRNGLKKWRI